MSYFYVGSLSDENSYYFFGSTKGNLVFINLFMFQDLQEIVIYLSKIDDCPIKWINTYGGENILVCSKKGKFVMLDFNPGSQKIRFSA